MIPIEKIRRVKYIRKCRRKRNPKSEDEVVVAENE